MCPLELLNMLASFVVAGANLEASGPASGCCPGVIGIVFLSCGYQTVTGTARDTRGNAIGSILLGLLQIAAAIVIGFLASVG